MTDLVLVFAQLAAVTGPAAALVVPRWRPNVTVLLVVLAGAALAAAAVGSGATRTLDVVHHFAAFDGQDIGVEPFPVETVEAPGWRWGLVAALFCLLWALVVWSLRPRSDDDLAKRRLGERAPPFLLPLLLAWSAIAAKLLLEKTAAPAALVDPVGWERVLVPPSFAAAILIGNRLRRILPTILWLALFVTAARLPLALFGSLATTGRWGTSLDVHRTEVFANPFAQTAIQVEPGTAEQMAWLLWAPHVVVLPALYMLSLVGIAFAVVMIVTHPDSQ